MGEVAVAGAVPRLSHLVFPANLTRSGLGFDPIFYMHHANVDRQLSLWAALHPGVWITEDIAAGGTFALPDNTPIDGHTCKY